MKKLFILLSVATIMACNSSPKADEKTENKETTSEVPAPPSDAPPEVEKVNPMAELAGTYKQEVKGEIPNLSNAKQLASIEITLNEDGTFKGSQKLMSNSISMEGSWKFENEEVQLNWNGAKLHLKPDGAKRTLTDEKEGVTLEKQ